MLLYFSLKVNSFDWIFHRKIVFLRIENRIWHRKSEWISNKGVNFGLKIELKILGWTSFTDQISKGTELKCENDEVQLTCLDNDDVIKISKVKFRPEKFSGRGCFGF